MKHLTLANGVWLAIYLAVMGIGLWQLHRVHNWALATYGEGGEGKERQAEWDRWRQEAAEQSEGRGPVQRRVPKSAEPPTLVLLRDHYVMCVSAFLLFGSVLFGVCMFLVRGIVSSPGRLHSDG
jgi:hypothetical protein